MTDTDEPQPKKPRAKLAAPESDAAPKSTRPAGTAPKRRRKPAPPPPPPPTPKVSLWWAAGTALVILGLDQLTKWIVVQALNLVEVQAIDVIDPWLNLRMAWNQGVNFGLFSSDVEVMRWVLIGIAVVICVWVAVWLLRARPGKLAQVAAGLLIGGALGNVIDRVVYGAVADFLNMSLPGWRNPYSFNVADIAIFAGALGLVFQPGPPSGPEPATPRDKVRDGTGKTR
ncbi:MULTISPECIES: signal peptidase II [unclassified Paracoccus (in: a-proteobacteria)]|uniref:signal peptidase II n=1 Tax=unclassified Paracoccus (in: a-proteobacteria) TaxID=2688777 RepID=UPI0016030629|nr:MULTISPECIES: signal peptidase II [unclassified Paracoccus (in: a-proteobacteria)]MBB1492108.1 signal peptidase II [Paracoccus sp. MC1854]MBB1497994.1 signal peptidase II [Paracoccus sp. MC1862]QQO44377.1 signal peptidase II [Paracoccus sp. MC1862]